LTKNIFFLDNLVIILIWHAVIWMLWKVRNDKIFKDTVCEVPNLVEEIKVLSWCWSLTR